MAENNELLKLETKEESVAQQKVAEAVNGIISEARNAQPKEGKASGGGNQKGDDTRLKDGAGDNVGSYFTNLPIGQLICTPFIELARGQAELCDVYVDTLFRLAFEKPEGVKYNDEGTGNNTRILKFSYDRPVVTESTQTVETKHFEINAPLLSLVPIPAFLIDSADVNFNMEVNIATEEKKDSSASAETNVKFGFWKMSGNIGGKVSSSSNITNSRSQKATYTISAHASQQPAAEGMSKLTALLAETMEPIQV